MLGGAVVKDLGGTLSRLHRVARLREPAVVTIWAQRDLS